MRKYGNLFSLFSFGNDDINSTPKCISDHVQWKESILRSCMHEVSLRHVPLPHSHSRGQSRASLGSGRSSGAEPERDVSDSSAAHFSLPWCSFAKERRRQIETVMTTLNKKKHKYTKSYRKHISLNKTTQYSRVFINVCGAQLNLFSLFSRSMQ